MDPAAAPPQFSTAEFQPDRPDSHGLFVRGLLFGAGAALLGLILYSAVSILTGYVIGFVSLAVGYIVARGILMGSRGRTGLRYQIAAAALTYAAVSLSAIPIAIAQFSKVEAELKKIEQTLPPDTKVAPTDPVAATLSNGGSQPEASLLPNIPRLLYLGLASPFLDLQSGSGGLIGLIILAVGVRIAWRMTGDAASVVQNAMAPPGPPGETPTSLNLNR